MTGALEALAAALGGGRPLPPVDRWNPRSCGRIDIRIAADGRWWHEGRVIERPALVRLFSTVLRRDDDGFHLVTPVEKLAIAVEDAPFVAVAMEHDDKGLRFVTNVGDLVVAGPERPIRLESGPDGGPRPYLRVRGGLDARLSRPVFYELAALAEERGGRFLVEAPGGPFDLGPAGERA